MRLPHVAGRTLVEMRRPPSPRQIVNAARSHLPWVPSPENEGSPLPYVARRPTVNPVLPVPDMAEAIAFYRRLGFDVEQFDDGYAWVRTCGWEFLHLAHAANVEPGRAAAGAYVHVTDADEWHVAITAAAGEDAAIGGVVDQPWGMREFAVTDPAGNIVRFGRNL